MKTIVTESNLKTLFEYLTMHQLWMCQMATDPTNVCNTYIFTHKVPFLSQKITIHYIYKSPLWSIIKYKLLVYNMSRKFKKKKPWILSVHNNTKIITQAETHHTPIVLLIKKPKTYINSKPLNWNGVGFSNAMHQGPL